MAQRISEKTIQAFVERLQDEKLKMHGMIMMDDGSIFEERYWGVHSADRLHRMFSAGKSMTSVAIGLMQEEGRISINDKICGYFPEKLPKEVHPYIEAMTIRNLLMMATAHKSTTYKRYNGDWVESFFHVEPSHEPGTEFNYDTSATHVLSALVEKLTGQKLIDYLRDNVLKYTGLAKDAYFVEDPAGVSQGGAGLACTLRDLAGFGAMCCNGGSFEGRQLVPAEYMKEASSKLIDTSHKSVPDEQNGYGYQFWRTREPGFCCYGMGGQLALCYPDKKFVFASTADIDGGPARLKLLYDAFYELVYPEL